MMMVSASYAFTFPTYYVLNSVTYKINSSQIVYDNPICSNSAPSGYVEGAIYILSSSFISGLYRRTDPNNGTTQSICYLKNRSGFSYYESSSLYYPSTCNGAIVNGECVPCNSHQTLTNGVCVDNAVDTNNSNCDPIGAQFTSSTTGKCVDCMPFTGLSSRASCACDALGSTYTPTTKGVSYWYVSGVYSYKKQRVTCDDGQSVFIYYDPVNTTPDTNTSTPSDTNGTKPPDANTTTNTPDINGSPVTTPTQADVVNALKSIQDGQKDSNMALKELGVDLKSVNTSLKEQGFTFDSILAKIVDGNSKADARYALMDTEYKGNTQYRNMMGKWVDQDLKNATAQLGATIGVQSAVNGTTGAVNAQGDKLGGKLDDILKAIKDGNGTGTKDGNGTDLSKVEDKLDTLHKDNNSSQAKLDTLHGDANTTNSTLKDIKNLLDFNASKYSINDLMPSGGEGWFTTNRLDLNFNNYGGDCYCQTAEFSVAGHQFIFPPQESLDVIPFTTISNIFMAFIYVLGLKAFIKS